MRGTFAAIATALPFAAAAQDHPLDALTADELSRAVAILTEAGHADEGARFPALTLMEPDKAEVLAWAGAGGGEMPARRAFAAIRRGPETFEAVVDLEAGAVESHRLVEGVESGILLEEWELALTATIEDERWQEAMRARGYESFDDLFCAPLSTGFFGEEEPHAGARILKVPCFDTAGAQNNLWGRPIEGLLTVVDLNEGRVIDVIDTGVVPVAAEAPVYGEAAGERAALRPVTMAVPQGDNFEMEGGEVTWQNWSFHMRFDRRVGAIVSMAAFDEDGDGGEAPRSVAYQIALSEMFVPYMDADPGWYFRSYMDIGEYGFGLLSSELRAGVDCPEHATFLEATIADDMGGPITMPSVVCVFERPTGNPLWRHAEIINGTYEGRPEVDLVVRTIPTVGNYDYVIDTVFTQRGEIAIDTGATGIDATKGVETTHMSDPTAEADTAAGALVAPNIVAVYHDHYLSFRLDLDVDGPANTLIREEIVPQRVEGPRRSIWALEPTTVTEEGPVAERAHGEVWRVINPGRETALGHNPGFQIEPGHGALSILSPDDFPQARAAFSSEPLWVTAHDGTELYAAGDYPMQSRGGDGLPEFVSDGDPVEDADLVLWYTVGFHHVTRAEDWPVLPTKWHGFKLRPYNFFDANPSIDVPRDFEQAQAE